MSTTTTEPTFDAAALLQEAGDTLALTYWVTGDEFVSSVYDDIQLEAVNLPDKHLKARRNNGQTTVITGMCSIGAMSLARHMHDTTPLEEFGGLESHDWTSFLAGLVLAKHAIAQDHTNCDLESRPSSLIAGWNDSKSQYDVNHRNDVVNTFYAAAKDPLAKAESVWLVKLRGKTFFYPWATEAEAEAALKKAIEVRTLWQDAEDYADVDDLPATKGFEPWHYSMSTAGYFDGDLEEMTPVEVTAATFTDRFSY